MSMDNPPPFMAEFDAGAYTGRPSKGRVLCRPNRLLQTAT
jgi:hypothetical protein